MSLWQLVGTTSKTEFSSSLNKFIVLIFRGDFLGSHKSCNFDTSTHNRDNHALSNAYEIVPELIVFTEIQTHEY